MLWHTVLVAAGGLLGSVARFWISGWAQRIGGSPFPYGTLTVNVLGSFAVGVVAALSYDRGTLSLNARLFLGVGFCGGFTTMSTFSYECFELLREGNLWPAALNVAATLIACIGGAWAGAALTRVA